MEVVGNDGKELGGDVGGQRQTFPEWSDLSSKRRDGP